MCKYILWIVRSVVKENMPTLILMKVLVSDHLISVMQSGIRKNGINNMNQDIVGKKAVRNI